MHIILHVYDNLFYDTDMYDYEHITYLMIQICMIMNT